MELLKCSAHQICAIVPTLWLLKRLKFSIMDAFNNNYLTYLMIFLSAVEIDW